MTVKDIRERWTRYTIDVPLRYLRVAVGGGRSKGGRARNLNFRGAWVDLPEQVEPGSVLEITLATPVVKLSLVGRVAWAHSGLRDGQYLHGVRFGSVTSEQREGFRALFAYERASPARLSCFLAATCQRNANGYVTIPGIVRDLSDGGVCIRLPQRVAPETNCASKPRPRSARLSPTRTWSGQTKQEEGFHSVGCAVTVCGFSTFTFRASLL